MSNIWSYHVNADGAPRYPRKQGKYAAEGVNHNPVGIYDYQMLVRIQSQLEALGVNIQNQPAVNIGNQPTVDIGNLPIGVNVQNAPDVVQQNGQRYVLDLTFSLNAGVAYAVGDVLAETQALAINVTGAARGRVTSLVVIDEDDQGEALDVVVFGANSSLGTENSPVSISDAHSRDLLGIIRVGETDYHDWGGVRVAQPAVEEFNFVTSDETLYVGAISQGTGTYTASGIRIRLGTSITNV